MRTGATWDPEPGLKEWYRERMTGDTGWLVRRGGQDVIRLDLPGMEVTRPYSVAEWEPKDHVRPVTRFDRTRVAFAADRELCRLLGMHLKARKEWHNLTELERQEWMFRGPKEPARRKLYEAVMAAVPGAEQ